MSEINKLKDFSSINALNIEALSNSQSLSKTQDSVLESKELDLSSLCLDVLPSLESPKGQMSMSVIASLSEEALMQMLNMDERKSAVQSGIASLKAHSEQRQEILQERVEKLQEQAKKLKEQSLLDKIKSAFSYIGMALGAIASIVTIAVGVVTSNPLLIAGGAMMAVAICDQVVTQASGGEQGLASWFAKAASATKGNETAAYIAGQVFSSLIGIIGGIVSGVGATKAVSTASDISSITNITAKVTKLNNIAGGLSQVANGGLSIASCVNKSDILKLQADTKLLDAILARIQAASDLDTQSLANVLKKSQAVVEAIKSMIDDSAQTLANTACASPNMA